MGGSNPQGGAIGERALGIALDANADAYIVGYTASSDFPVTQGAFQTSITNFDGAAFIAEINPTGTGLIYATFPGGSPGGSQANAVVVDSSGNAYVAGLTGSANLPITPGAFQTTTPGGIAPIAAAKNSGLPLCEKAGAGLALALLLWPFGRRKPNQRLALSDFASGGRNHSRMWWRDEIAELQRLCYSFGWWRDADIIGQPNRHSMSTTSSCIRQDSAKPPF